MQTVNELHMELVRARLTEIAEALNALRDLGVPAKARYDAVMTDHGYVLQMANGQWQVGMKVFDPDEIPRGDPDDD